MNIRRHIYIVLILLVLFSISAVTAADDAASDVVSDDTNQEITLDETVNDDVSAIENYDDELILDDNDAFDKPTLGEVTSTGSFTDLNDLINVQYATNDTITLSSNYTFNGTDDDDSNFLLGIGISREVTIDGNGCTIDGINKARIFNIGDSGTVKFLNINFINGIATGRGLEGYGGAIFALNTNCIVENCNFTNNSAVNGGALMGVTAYNCTFTENKATEGGGAMFTCDSYNCNFKENRAEESGGAKLHGNSYKCNFTGNQARSGGAISTSLSGTYSATLCMFDSNSPNDYTDITIVEAFLSADNLTTNYKSGEKLLFNLTCNDENHYGFNTTITIYENDVLVGTSHALSGEGWVVNLTPGTYNAVLSLDKYAGVRNGNATITVNKLNAVISPSLDNIGLFVGDSSQLGYTLNPSDASGDIIITSNDTSVVTVDASGNIKAVSAGTATITISLTSTYYTATNATVNVVVSKKTTEITPTNPTINLSVGDISKAEYTLNPTDASGDISFKSSNPNVVTIDSNGKIKAVGAGTATITISLTSTNYDAQDATVTITVSKKSTQITASGKTFKFKDKTKKYTVTLKDNKGNILKNKKVTLKVNGKTYTATTNSKGVATFKLSKLSKKGTYTAVVTYAGDKTYNKVTKKAKVTIKAPAKKKEVWKTISKGSKDKSTVKKIQKALKKNGYYLSYKDRYLKIDGIYHKYTEMGVKQFQKAKGLKVTGKIDEKTAKKLKLI